MRLAAELNPDFEPAAKNVRAIEDLADRAPAWRSVGADRGLPARPHALGREGSGLEARDPSGPNFRYFQNS